METKFNGTLSSINNGITIHQIGNISVLEKYLNIDCSLGNIVITKDMIGIITHDDTSNEIDFDALEICLTKISALYVGDGDYNINYYYPMKLIHLQDDADWCKTVSMINKITPFVKIIKLGGNI